MVFLLMLIGDKNNGIIKNKMPAILQRYQANNYFKTDTEVHDISQEMIMKYHKFW